MGSRGQIFEGGRENNLSGYAPGCPESSAKWGGSPWPNLIQNIEGRRLEEQEGQDEGKGQEGPLTPAQLREGLFPDLPKGYPHLQTCNIWTLTMRV